MSPSFRTKRIKLPKTLGEYLKSRREERGISLALAERELRIRKDYLELLETGDFDQLPADVYVRGILKNYAEFLGINYKKTILPRYLREKGIHTSVYGEKKGKVDITKTLKSPKIVLTPRTLVIFGVLVFVLGLGFYLWYQFSAFASAPELSVNQPAEGTKLNTNLVNIVGKTNPGVELTINGQQIGLAEDGTFKNRLSLQEGVNLIEVIAKNKVGKQTIVQRNVMVTLPKTSKRNIVSKEEAGVEIILTIQNGATWISVEEDDQPAFEGTMLPGSSQVFRGKKSITITSGRGVNTLLQVNDQDWGVLEDTTGVVRDLVITKAMAEKGR